MIIYFLYNGKRLSVDVKRLGYFSKGIGLMFKSKNSENLLFEFKKDVGISIHSYFVFFPFLAVWLDKRDNVISFELVKPFNPRIKLGRKFRKLIEIPVNDKNTEIITFFVGKGKV